MNKYLKAALGYLDREWAALALCPPDHRGVDEYHRRTCTSPGKRPLGRWKHLQARLPTVDELVAAWEGAPQANVGIVLGRVSGLVGIDLDGEGAEAILQEVSGGDLPRTTCFTTGRGRRLLYALSRERAVATRTWARDGSEVKLLGEGTVTVMPPSKHACGRSYRWARRRGLADLAPAPAPGWVLAPRVTVRPAKRRRQCPARECSQSVGGIIREGERNRRLFRVACALRGEGLEAAEILAAISAVNSRRCRPPLDEAEMLGIVRSASKYRAGCIVE